MEKYMISFNAKEKEIKEFANDGEAKLYAMHQGAYIAFNMAKTVQDGAIIYYKK